MGTGRLGDRTVGVLRCAVLALLAPVFAMPAAAVGATSAPDAHPASRSVRQSVDVAADRVVVRHRDGVTRGAGSARLSSLQAPSSIRLLAARLYWGDAPPAYPSTRSARADLDRTAAYFERVSRGQQTVPRQADPLGPRERRPGDHVQPPGRVGAHRAARARPRRLPPAALQPADAADRAVQRGRVRRAAAGQGELDPLPQPRHGHAGPRARSQPRPPPRLRPGLPPGRPARPARWPLPLGRVRRQLGRHGPLARLVLRARPGPARLGR